MNNLKKIGLSALAGSLAFTSAHAIEANVGVAAEMTYTPSKGVKDASVANPWGMKSHVLISASGDVNGIGVTYNSNLTDKGASQVSGGMSFDFGDMGRVTFDQGGFYGQGVHGLDNAMPTAYEEAFHGVNGSARTGNEIDTITNALGYNNTIGPVSISVAYNPGASDVANGDGGTTTNSTDGAALTYMISGEIMDGLTLAVGAGKEEVPNTAHDDKKIAGAYAIYTMGPVSVGYGVNTFDSGQGNSTATAVHNEEQKAYSIAANVNDSLSLSYGIQETEFAKAGAAHVTQENKSISAAYTMGNAALRLVTTDATDVGGTKGTDHTYTEVSLNLSF